MSLGEKLLNLRKKKGLSQEEAADILGATRQTISKWETDQSTPDFDKIVPICELYYITPNELIMEKECNIVDNRDITQIDKKTNEYDKQKRTEGIAQSVFIFFIAVAWIMISPTVLMINPVISSAIFLLILGIGTYKIIYTKMLYKNNTEETNLKQIQENKKKKKIRQILAIITLLIYLCISFLTNRWDVTWIIWIVFVFIVQILNFVFLIKYEENK